VTTINDVASCLKFKAKAKTKTKTLDDMERAIEKGIKEKYK
jgi:hypothetical protein